MGVKIKGSVGKRGKNDKADVETIQKLLNKHTKQGGYKKLTPDGISGNKTIGAIDKFQTNVAGVKKSDGRVDCGKNTFKALCKSPEAVAKKDTEKGAGKVCGKTAGVKKELLVFLQAVADHYGTTITITRGKIQAKKAAEDMINGWGQKVWKSPLFILATTGNRDISKWNKLYDEGVVKGDRRAYRDFVTDMEGLLIGYTGYPTGEAVDIGKSTSAKVRAALKTGLEEWPHAKGIHYNMLFGKPPKVTDKIKAKWKK